MKQGKLLWKFVVILIVLLLVVVGCGTTEPEPEEPTAVEEEEQVAEPEPEEEEPVAEEPIELAFWHIHETWWSEYVEKFNEEHPNVTVKLEVFETEAYKPKISSAVIAGTEPCMFYQIPGPETETWLENGEVLKIGDYLDVNRFVPAAQAGCDYKGDFVCMPFYLSPSFFYYNKAMFADAGVDPANWADPMQPTWDEFIAAGEALKEAGYVPIALGNADNWPGLFFYWATQNRYGGVAELNGAVYGPGAYTDPSFIKAGEVVVDLVERGFFPEGLNGIGGADKYNLFTQEVGAMIYMGTWMTGNIANDAAEDFEYGIFHYPSFPDGDPDSQTDIMSGIDAAWISADCPHIDVAAEFLQGFYDPDNAMWFLEETGNIPSVAGVVEQAKTEGFDSPALLLAEASAGAAHAYAWWDWLLPPAITEEMLSMSQGLFSGDISPQEFAERMEALR
jgi:raffinose/stachyose/melibiose transport system substrate-binding protein